MASEKDYRAAASRYLALAADTRDPEIARLLRVLAEDCLQEAQRAPVQMQQQQQIQPENQKPEDD